MEAVVGDDGTRGNSCGLERLGRGIRGKLCAVARKRGVALQKGGERRLGRLGRRRCDRYDRLVQGEARRDQAAFEQGQRGAMGGDGCLASTLVQATETDAIDPRLRHLLALQSDIVFEELSVPAKGQPIVGDLAKQLLGVNKLLVLAWTPRRILQRGPKVRRNGVEILLVAERAENSCVRKQDRAAIRGRGRMIHEAVFRNGLSQG